MRKTGSQQRDTKTELLDAAERLFGRHSLDGVSMRQIATAVGCAAPRPWPR
jgi:AcrR family transcriptional regulator